MKFYLLSILLLMASCSQDTKKQDVDVTEKQTELLVKEDISAIKYTEYILDSKAVSVLDSWQKYKELETLFGNVKNANLSFFKDNHEVLKAFLDELKETLPEEANTPAIYARLKIIETFCYKIEDQLKLSDIDKNELLGVIKEFLMSYSNLNFQINKKFEKESQNIQKP